MWDLIILFVLLVLGYSFGTYREKKHYRSIFSRETEYKNILLFDNRSVPNELDAKGGELVLGHVVISVDYFKAFVAGLRKFIGGQLRSYETLLDRGRREAVLRMKQQAKQKGCDMVINVKFETTSISKGANKALGTVEVYVYGSALKTNQTANHSE